MPAYSILLYVSCSLSIVGDIFITMAILSFKDLRTFNYRMILYLTLTDVIAAMAYMLTPLSKTSHSLCILQAYLINFSSLSSLLWTSCIMIALYRLIILEKFNEKYLELIFCAFSWAVPLVASVISISDYGITDNWCWIDDSHIFMIILQFYVPLLAVVVFNIFLCVVIWKELRKHTGSVAELHVIKRKVFKRMMLYPLVLLICFIPAAIHRFSHDLLINDNSGPIDMTSMLGSCLYGFFNSIVYGCTQTVRKKIISKIFPFASVRKDSLMIQKESFPKAI